MTPLMTPLTTPKVHIHMRVSDLAKSRDFYERLFGAGPVKEKPGYVKFLPDWAPVNLALSQARPGSDGAIDHVGVQVVSTDVVLSQLGRVKAAGLAVREEMAVDCCHANQDKFWVQDPDGVEWEVYHLNYDLDEEATQAAPSARAGGLPLVAAGGCCGSNTPCGS
jgi:catechol 2,3-dioxygenase-like lactoylglutathione lyase family enzyme